MLKKTALSLILTPALTTMAFGHADPNAHGSIMAQVAHIHFGADYAIALGVVGIFIAGLIGVLAMKRSATKSRHSQR